MLLEDTLRVVDGPLRGMVRPFWRGQDVYKSGAKESGTEGGGEIPLRGVRESSQAFPKPEKTSSLEASPARSESTRNKPKKAFLNKESLSKQGISVALVLKCGSPTGACR